MRKILLPATILFFLLILNTENIFACSCVLPVGNLSLKKQVENSYKTASAVFSAEVIEISQQPNVYNVIIKLKVSKSWKRINSQEIILTTGRGGGDCGYRFEIGKKYLVYAYGERNDLGTGICSRTDLLKNNKDIKVLDKLKKKKT